MASQTLIATMSLRFRRYPVVEWRGGEEVWTFVKVLEQKFLDTGDSREVWIPVPVVESEAP